MRVLTAESTELFVGPPDAPLQLVRVTYTGCSQPTPVRVDGHGLAGEAVAAAGDEAVEIPVVVDDPVLGARHAARVRGDDSAVAFTFTVAEPGWTMFMISHF